MTTKDELSEGIERLEEIKDELDTSDIPLWYTRFDDLKGMIGTLERIIEKFKESEKIGDKWVDMEFSIRVEGETKTYSNAQAEEVFKKWYETI